MIPLALVSLQEAVDLFGVVGAVSLGVLGWNHLRRQDRKRRALRKEKQARYALARLRREREYEAAMRYRGGVVR